MTAGIEHVARAPVCVRVAVVWCIGSECGVCQCRLCVGVGVSVSHHRISTSVYISTSTGTNTGTIFIAVRVGLSAPPSPSVYGSHDRGLPTPPTGSPTGPTNRRIVCIFPLLRGFLLGGVYINLPVALDVVLSGVFPGRAAGRVGEPIPSGVRPGATGVTGVTTTTTTILIIIFIITTTTTTWFALVYAYIVHQKVCREVSTHARWNVAGTGGVAAVVASQFLGAFVVWEAPRGGHGRVED